MDKKDITAFFDCAASGWDSIQIRNEKAIEYILDKGSVSGGKKVLDVASGTGVLFPDYIKRGALVTGVDISCEMAKIAAEKFPDIKFIVADAEEYSFENDYDAVMIYNAFPHFPNPKKLLENLSKALKDKGRITVAHGLSEEELRKCHSTAAKNVSLPLPSKEELAEMMSDFFQVDATVSDGEKYLVSGIKK